jgi:predicted DNA-binding WGR domain protein
MKKKATKSTGGKRPTKQTRSLSEKSEDVSMPEKSVGSVTRTRRSPAGPGVLALTGALSLSELTKIRRLIESADSASVPLGVNLLDSLHAGPKDWAKVFTSSTIQKLVASWDIDVWQTVAVALAPFRPLRQSFEKAAVTRLNSQARHERSRFISAVLPHLPSDLTGLFGAFFKKCTPAQGNFGFQLGITMLSDHGAEALSHVGDAYWLELNGLSTLSDRAAASLATFGGLLSLSGITSLSNAGAAALARHGGLLRLDGLTTLTDSQAAALAGHREDLSLDSLTKLSDEAAGAFARHKGTLYLRGLTTLSDKAAASLSKHQGELYLDGLTTLSDGPGHVALAAALARVRGGIHLTLQSVTNISHKAAAALARKTDGLVSLGLTSVSEELARTLATFRTSLVLNDVTSLSDAAAESLAKHDGPLSLRGLKQLSSQAAEALLKAGHLSGHNECDDLKLDFDGPVAIDLVFSKNKSNKFWSIALEDCSHTVTFGRIGTAGQSQTKHFETPKKALNSFLALVREKTDNGYSPKA